MQSRRRFLVGSTALTTGVLSGCTGSGAFGRGRGELERVETADSPGGTVELLPAGSVVLLDFFATWCAPCRPQMAELRTVRDRHPDIHLLSITNETDRDAIRSFWSDYDGSWPVAVDPELRTNERFDVTRIPTKIIFNESGTEQWRHVGLSPAADIAKAIKNAGAER